VVGGLGSFVFLNFFPVRSAFLFFSRVGLCRLVECLPVGWGRPAIATNVLGIAEGGEIKAISFS